MPPADELPEDHNQWPASPLELFGVEITDDLRTARRSYIRLIRRFKPEYYPEQFQQLRAAFEQLEQMIAHREFYAKFEETVEDATQTESIDVGAFSSAPSLADDIESLWNRALEGEIEAAYAQGVSLWNSGRRDPNLAVRLYWLLFTTPGMDDTRTCDDWLYEAVVLSQAEGVAAELYGRLLRRDPVEATSERCSAFLEERYSTHAIANLLPHRWRSMASVSKWNLISADLDRLRPRLQYDEAMWSRILLAAIDELLWGPTQLNEPLITEFDRATPIGSDLYDEFHWIDYKQEVVSGWQKLQYAVKLKGNWCELVPGSFTKQGDELEPGLSRVLSEIVSLPPREALARFDAIRRESAAVCDYLGSLLQRYYHGTAAHVYDHYSPEAVHLVFESIGHLLHDPVYPRGEVLEFCLHFAIEPARVEEQAEHAYQQRRAHEHDQRGWLDVIAADGPLRCVYYAHRAVAASAPQPARG